MSPPPSCNCVVRQLPWQQSSGLSCGSAVLRELLQRDEAVLRHLLQQELKKAESLKATEAKVVKLREQLQASEKILTANRTLLRKLQEQVLESSSTRVSQHVTTRRC